MGGHLRRAHGSGSYVPGQLSVMKQAVLCFDPRARRKGSFGATLLHMLIQAMDEARLPWKLRWGLEAPKKADVFPRIVDTGTSLTGTTSPRPLRSAPA